MRIVLPKFYNQKKDLVICQICNKELRTLQTHIPRIHKISCEEYKEEYKLWNGDLMSISTRQKMSEYHNRPDVRKKDMKRFMEGVKPFSPENKGRGKIKARYRGMTRTLTEEGRISLSEKASRLHTPEIRLKASLSRRRGRFQICQNRECGKSYWVKPYMFETSKYCSMYCQGKVHWTNYWNNKKSVSYNGGRE